MERDEALTFREIHGSEEAFLAQIDKIENLLFEYQPLDEDFPLRFVTLDNRDHRNQEDGTINLRLTPLGEYDTSAPYIAISYTWKQSPKLEEAFASVIPRYLLWDSETSSRPLRCPPLVLHRGLAFARKHLSDPLVWIDQECIDQNDPKDVEIHLQRMHEVYRRAFCTLAILSQPILCIRNMHALEVLIQDSGKHKVERLANNPDELADIDRLLRHLANDTWFQRAWTFQERLCSTELNYVVVASLEATEVGQTQTDIFGLAESLFQGYTQDDVVDQTNGKSKRCVADVYITAEVFVKLFAALMYYKAKNPECPEQLAVRKSLRTVLVNISFTKNQCTPDFIFYPEIVRWMPSCMNRLKNDVVSDRLAIISNICNFRVRLKSADVNHAGISLATCMLVLIKHNGGLEGTYLMPSAMNKECSNPESPEEGTDSGLPVFEMDILIFFRRAETVRAWVG